MTTQDTAGQEPLSIDDLLDEFEKGSPAQANQPELPEVQVITEGEAPPPEKKEPERPKDDPVAKLKAEVEAARQREAALIAERNRAAQIAAKEAREKQAALARAQTSDYDLISNALDGANDKMASLEQQLANAFAEGDGPRVASIQKQMAILGARITQLEDGKARLEQQAQLQRQRAEAQRRQAQQRPQVQQHVDPFEASIAHYSEPSKKWLREHRALVSQPGKFEDVLAAHYIVVKKEKLAPDTPEYFEAIERELGLREPDPEPARTQAQPQQRRSLPAAPVSRGNGNGGKPTQVRLSAEEQRIAQELGMSNEEYARGKVLRDSQQAQMRVH